MEYFDNKEVNDAFRTWFSMEFLSKNPHPSHHPQDDENFYEFVLLLFKKYRSRIDIREQVENIVADKQLNLPADSDLIDSIIIKYEEIWAVYQYLTSHKQLIL
jgi:hypothetical protein